MERDTRILLLAGIIVLAGAWGWREIRTDKVRSEAVSLMAPRASGRPSVRILFTPRDCATMIESLRSWNAALRGGRVDVAGLLYGLEGRPGAETRVVRGAALAFPVTPVDDAAAHAYRAALGYADESVIVISDSRGRILFVLPLAALSTADSRARALQLAETVG